VPIKRAKPCHEPSCPWVRVRVATKAPGANPLVEIPPPPRAAGPGVSAEISAELASVAAALAADEDDVFSEVPTEANRANPMIAPNAMAPEAGQGLAGAGAYRMVRPAISDRIEIPAPAAPERPANRVIIGIARKA